MYDCYHKHSITGNYPVTNTFALQLLNPACSNIDLLRLLDTMASLTAFYKYS